MDFIQIGCITPDDLEHNREWLESLGDDFNEAFVEVEDGDFSLVRAIVEEAIPFDDPRLRDGYVCFDPKTIASAAIESLTKNRQECPPFWAGYKAYRPVVD